MAKKLKSHKVSAVTQKKQAVTELDKGKITLGNYKALEHLQAMQFFIAAKLCLMK